MAKKRKPRRRKSRDPDIVEAKFSTKGTSKRIALKRESEGKVLTRKQQSIVTQDKAERKLKQGQALQGIASITEAFSLGINAISQAEAIRQKGKFEEAQLIENAEQLDRASLDTLERGRITADETLEDARQTKGLQKAQLAATGVDITTGSARDVQEETIRLGIKDAKTIRTNAFRVAFGQKRQAIGRRFQARQTRISRKFRERTTLITGGLGALSAAASGVGSLAQSGAFTSSPAPVTVT